MFSLLKTGPRAIVVFYLAAVACRAEPPVPQIETVLIRGGTFTMGSRLKEAEPGFYEDELPLVVSVADFRIAKYPITAMQFCGFLNAEEAQKHELNSLYHLDIAGDDSAIVFTMQRFTPRSGADHAPVQLVTWKGAVAFCDWSSKKYQRRYRLPSEAEWEFAARGKDERLWPWGSESPSKKHGLVYAKRPYRSGNIDPPVGSYPANATPEGVSDMLTYFGGEWCSNKYGKTPSAEVVTDTTMNIDDADSLRVIRGDYRKSEIRYKGRLGKLLAATEYGWTATPGRVWTRVLSAPYGHAGFRVVEE
jgi:formylglycine-generating enzyme required for sulfatase activity